jgi:hypothetical protein
VRTLTTVISTSEQPDAEHHSSAALMSRFPMPRPCNEAPRTANRCSPAHRTAFREDIRRAALPGQQEHAGPKPLGHLCGRDAIAVHEELLNDKGSIDQPVSGNVTRRAFPNRHGAGQEVVLV